MSDTTQDGGLALSAPPSADDGLSASQLAAKYGLAVSGARPGLVAYVRQLWGRRHFILAFSRAKLTAQYSQAKLGQVWQVVTPLLNALVYFMIFGLILGTRRGMTQEVFIPFLVTGVFVFTFTQSSVMAGVKSISGNIGLVRALHFPRASLPISFSLQQLQQLMFSMIVLLARPSFGGVIFLAGLSAYVVVRQLLFPLRGLPRKTVHGRRVTLVTAAAVFLAAAAAGLLG